METIHKEHATRFLSWSVFLIFSIAALLSSLGHYFHGDEGIILNGAWKMWQGKKLYTDFFSIVAPGSYLWSFASFVILGPSYFSARFFSIFLLLASLYAIYHIALMLTGSRAIAFLSAWSWMIITLIQVLAINHNVQSTYLASIAAYFLIKALRQRVPAYYLAAGLFVGLVGFFLQTKGIFLLLGSSALLLGYVMTRRIPLRHAMVFLLGSSVMPAIALLVWPPQLLYELLVRWPTEHYLTVGGAAILPWLVSLAVAVGLTLWAHKQKDIDKDALWVLLVVQLSLLLSTFTRPALGHVLWNSFGIVILSSIGLFSYAANRISRLRFFQEKIVIEPRDFLSIAFVLLLSVALSVALGGEFKKSALPKIRSYGINALYAHPYLPQFYFELGVRDPYPYDILIAGMYPQGAFEANLRVLEKENPEYVLLSYGVARNFYGGEHDFLDFYRNNPLDRYITEHYQTIDHVGGVNVMKKRH